MQASKFLNQEDKEIVLASIADAEKNTSGEIRVHIESKCPGDVMDRAAYIFEKLKMHKTKLRNGVLFYIAADDRKCAILGDAGINAKTADDFWDNENEIMIRDFTGGNFAMGLSKAIRMAGEQLKAHFPYQDDDVNELPDDISFGN